MFDKLKKYFRVRYEATKLCLKYPFLYPRNRFTNKHYNNWKLNTKIKNLYSRAYEAGNKSTGFKPITRNVLCAVCWKILKLWYDYPMQVFHCIPHYTEWDAMEDGWRKAFGDQLLAELKEAMLADGGRKYLKNVRIMQIKEKRGYLNIYLNFYGDKTFDVIRKYENISYHTCINCGKPAVGVTTGWTCPYCGDCYNIKDEKHRKGFEFFDKSKNENNEDDED